MSDIIKIIKECSNKNFVKASKLIEKKLEEKIYAILEADKEEMLALDEIEDDKEELKESEDREAKFKALLADYGVENLADLSDEQKSELFTKLKESEDKEDGDDVLKESDEEELKEDCDEEDCEKLSEEDEEEKDKELKEKKNIKRRFSKR